MSESKHTPGPWRVAASGNFSNVIEAHCGRQNDEFDDGYRTVAMFQACTGSRTWEAQDANAAANGRLIAAAPDLLALVKRYRAETPLGHQPHMIAAEADALIAKAEGRS